MDLEQGGIVGRQRRAAGGAKGISEAGGGEGGLACRPRGRTR